MACILLAWKQQSGKTALKGNEVKSAYEVKSELK